MKNISFDNPYLLLIAIPLLAAVIIPFAIAIRRENRSKGTVISFVVHLVIVVLVTLAAAGMEHVTTVTKTQVYVVADVSYSSSEKLDVVDEYIANVEASLPKNAEMGVVVFGKNPVLYTSPGDTLRSVADVKVDNSETNITKAVKYAAALFDGTAMRRIVLITDGMDTTKDGVESFTALVEELHARDIAIDAMFVDSNISDSSEEVQISGATFSEKTYLNHETTADILVQSARDTSAILTLKKNGVEAAKRAVNLTRGFNVVNIDMPTGEAGTFDYVIEVKADADTSTYNNAYSFVQSVSADLNILFMSQSKADLDAARAIYGERANIDAYMILPRAERKEVAAYTDITLLEDLPITVEDLCKYDEILLSNIDVSEIENISYFIEVVEKVVSEFGKSLVTIGDNKIQNSTDETLLQLEKLLPVRYGNTNQDPKLYGIVIDCSRSMYTASRLTVAKQAATYLLNILNDGDYVAVIQFAGESFVIQSPIDAINRDEIAREIDEKVQPLQGTFIGGGLQKTYEEFLTGELASMYSEKQIILISDGLTFTAETADAAEVARQMYEEGIVTSVINPYCSEQAGIDLLQAVAANGGGTYYYIENQADLEDVMFSEIAQDVTESVVEGETAINIERYVDDVLNGVTSLPNIYGYIQSKAKPGATVVLSVDYKKASGSTITVPLYAYRDFENGRITSITTSLWGEWAKAWTTDESDAFLQNILTVNTPEEKIDYPYRLSVEAGEGALDVEIIPIVLNPHATASATLTMPSGESVTLPLAFDSEKYLGSFTADRVGKYELKIDYSYKDEGNPAANFAGIVTYTSTNYYNISYSKEYDSFAAYSPAGLNASIRHRGVVTEDGTVDLSPDESQIATYTLQFAAPFMVAAVALFVIDVIVRKIKLADLRSLFDRKSKGGRTK